MKVAASAFACLALPVLGYFTFLAYTTGEGRPVCMSNFSQATREQILWQGVWSHLQARPAIRSVLGVGQRARVEGAVPQGDPEAPIDLQSVRAFLAKHPGCCSVRASGEGKSGLHKHGDRFFGSNIAFVSVVDPTLKSQSGNQIRQGPYTVDACSKNLERMK